MDDTNTLRTAAQAVLDEYRSKTYSILAFEAKLSKLGEVLAQPEPAPSHDELSRYPDGDIAIDWITKDRDMLSMSLSKSGTLTWAVHRAGPAGHGTAQLTEACYWTLSQVLDEAEAEPAPTPAAQVQSVDNTNKLSELHRYLSDTLEHGTVNEQVVSRTALSLLAKATPPVALPAVVDAEAVADKKRLDWLDAAAVDMLLEFGFEMEGGVYLRIDAPGHGGTDIREKNSARDLIDTAMVVAPC